jgi:hypothetical protein
MVVNDLSPSWRKSVTLVSYPASSQLLAADAAAKALYDPLTCIRGSTTSESQQQPSGHCGQGGQGGQGLSLLAANAAQKEPSASTAIVRSRSIFFMKSPLFLSRVG